MIIWDEIDSHCISAYGIWDIVPCIGLSGLGGGFIKDSFKWISAATEEDQRYAEKTEILLFMSQI